MKKSFLMMILLYLNSYAFQGNIYYMTQKGNGYKGTLEGRVMEKNTVMKIIPIDGVEIKRVNGTKNENNIYQIDSTVSVDFEYRLKEIPESGVIKFGTVEYLNEAGKIEDLYGKVGIDFRKQGKIDLKVKGDMDFGMVDPKISKNGVSSKKNPKINIKLDLDKKDVGMTKVYFEYPKEIEMGEGQMKVRISEEKSIGQSTTEVKLGKELGIIQYLPNKSNSSEEVELKGTLYSNVKEIKSGSYSSTVKIKAYYEYINFSTESPNKESKIIVRR